MTSNLAYFKLEISSWLDGSSFASIEELQEHRRKEHSSTAASVEVKRLVTDRLLLTFNQFPTSSITEARDDVFFDQFSFRFCDHQKAENLVYILNSIKEEFATARHLYCQARYRADRISSLDSINEYGEPRGGEAFGLIPGYLKASLRQAIDVLDKVAVFCVLYFDLGDPAKNFNFNNFWFLDRNPGRGIIHPKLESRFEYSWPLKGLRDIQRDFYQQTYPGPLKRIRDITVHRWLSLDWLGSAEQGERDPKSVEDFSNLTRFALRQAKAAILTLFAIVNLEESRKSSEAPDPDDPLLSSPLRLRSPRPLI